MSKLEGFIQEKQQNAEDWKARKETEREELNLMSEDGIMTVTQEPEAYLRYLDVQADNPRYSATNILLALAQNPDLSQIHSLEQWNKLGRSVKREESGLKIRVSDPYVKDGQEYQGYKVGRVFDISQTTGKGQPVKITLKEDSPQMDAALRQLLDLSPVKVTTNTTESIKDAYYDPASQEISVSSHLTDLQTFAALSREIVHARIHNHGQYPYYSREESCLDADSLSYMLCRSFGIPAERPDASNIFTLNDGMEPKDRRATLDTLQQIFRKMHGDIQKEAAPPEKQPEPLRQTR